MHVLLISTYDLGRQPFGLASPAAWLRQAGHDVVPVDVSRAPLEDAAITDADLVAFYLPMHTATRLAAPIIDRVRRLNPSAHVCGYGLYAPLNADWLRARGVHSILGGEFEEKLLAIARQADGARRGEPASVGASVPDPRVDGERPGIETHERPASATGRTEPAAGTGSGGTALLATEPSGHAGTALTIPAVVPRLHFLRPDRAGLPDLQQYAMVLMPDGTRRLAGSTDASRGCKHLCRHCPIVPVYQGQFRVVPVDVVLDDVRAQVEAGATHISFADPDFFNGPTHATRIVQRLAAEHPGVSYDATIKIEHLLQHADLLPLLRDTGCLFITSAVESVDDQVLLQLAKGHTRADFIRVVELCRASGLTLSPTFVPFTPWTTRAGYLDLVETLAALDLVEHVAPIQLAIRLLVTAGSALLELPDIRAHVTSFDPDSLTWPWQHRDPGVDELQRAVIKLVGARGQEPRADVFAAIADLAVGAAGRTAGVTMPPIRPGAIVPRLNEAWYCCAEPDAELI